MNSNKYDKFTNNIFVEYLKEKRSLGYKYDDEELILLRFDNYCNENNRSNKFHYRKCKFIFYHNILTSPD